jgi:hypothetical protein
MKERARKLAPGSGKEPKDQKRYNVTLTLRQRRYIRGRQAGLSKYAAALQAGYSRLVALNAKEKIENCVAVRRVLDQWLDQQGLSDGALKDAK